MAGLLLWLGLLVAGPAARAQAPAWQAAVTSFQTGGNSSRIQASAADVNGNVYVAGTFSGTIVLGTIGLISAGSNDVFVAKWSSASGNFVWAQRAGGPAADEAAAIAVNGASVYLTGTFTGTAAFGGTALVSAGAVDVFVAKLTDAGPAASFVWAQRAGGSLQDRSFGVAVSGASVYLTGIFEGTTTFGGTAPLVSAGSFDVFVAKLTDAGASGTFSWARRAGGPSLEFAGGVAASGTSVYLTGGFTGTAAFGGTALTSAGSSDVFVAKLTDAGSSGAFAWAQRAGGTGFDNAAAVAVSGANVYITGNFSGTTSFGAAFLVSVGSDDAFVAKLTDTGPAGSFVWAQRGGGPGADAGYFVAVSGANVYASGYFNDAASFGSTALIGIGNEAFLAKFVDAGGAGSVAWAQRGGGPGSDVADGVAVGGQNVYVVGYVTPPATFGPFAFAAPTNTFVGFLASLRDPTLTATRPALSAESIALFPNPAHTATTVRLPAVPGAATATLTLLDGLGRTVRRQQVALPAAGAAAEVSVAGLAPGLYRLLVQAGGQQASRALAVE